MTEIPSHLLDRARHARERAADEERRVGTPAVEATEVNLRQLIAELQGAKTKARAARVAARAADEEARALEQTCGQLRDQIDVVIEVLADPPTMGVRGMPKR